MTISRYHPCRTCQLGQPHRSAGVQLLGGYADLCPETKLLAVGEPGRGVHHHGRRVTAHDERLRRRQRVGDDGFGVTAPPLTDVRDSVVDRVDDTRGDVEREVLRRPVVVGDRYDVRAAGSHHCLVAMHGDTGVAQSGQDARQEDVRDIAVHQQRLRRVAPTRRVRLRVSVMSTAMSRSASASTYTWQLPTPVSMTGTVDSSTTLRMRPAPPRGMRTSTKPRARMRCFADSWSVPGTSWTVSVGSPALSPASARMATNAALLDRALDEPRSSTALPLLRHRPAASTVTLGRAS